MSDLHDDDELDDEVALKPLWRRRKVQVLAISSVLAIAWMWQHGQQPPPKHEAEKLTESYIGAVQPYQPVSPPPMRKVETPPPAPPSQPVANTPTSVAAPDARPAANPMAGMAIPKAISNASAVFPTTKPVSHRPAMLSYAVRIDPPKPPAATAAPQETGLTFKAAQIPGAKASPAIDETLMLTPGLLPLVLDTAIDSNNPGPILA
ncbi:MAG: hypothetical protein JSS43_21245, partial [Proteobacteria bacterium]|nr:hypothetical protein [Pseudomonadota bacterium]